MTTATNQSETLNHILLHHEDNGEKLTLCRHRPGLPLRILESIPPLVVQETSCPGCRQYLGRSRVHLNILFPDAV